jgi:rRNA maturation endonuclease Nob1
MSEQLLSHDQIKSNRETVNQAVRICINCGNIAVKIENHGIFCKDCGSFLDLEKEDE